jgi:hypothetical protein
MLTIDKLSGKKRFLWSFYYLLCRNVKLIFYEKEFQRKGNSRNNEEGFYRDTYYISKIPQIQIPICYNEKKESVSNLSN